ncbi:unnamed protein product [Prorocentrum cordatum]|uniref:RNA helicase n=1 Tax=Prorocentrum cordatum TaxID=2364126 RepID=A0ABN9UNM3_9DINO|nr:unnamed protein product [Polarella glacialis]
MSGSRPSFYPPRGTGSLGSRRPAANARPTRGGRIGAAAPGMPLEQDPTQHMHMMQESMRKELLAWKSPVQLAKLISNAKPPETMPWRPPVPGDQVAISGMRRRPELNGARAEVLGNEADEFGRVVVRVFDGTRAHKMRVQPFKLLPTGPQASAAAGSAGRAGAQQARCPLPLGGCRRGQRASGAAVPGCARGRAVGEPAVRRWPQRALRGGAVGGAERRHEAPLRHLPGGILSASASAPQL